MCYLSKPSTRVFLKIGERLNNTPYSWGFRRRWSGLLYPRMPQVHLVSIVIYQSHPQEFSWKSGRDWITLPTRGVFDVANYDYDIRECLRSTCYPGCNLSKPSSRVFLKVGKWLNKTLLGLFWRRWSRLSYLQEHLLPRVSPIKAMLESFPKNREKIK